MPETKITRIMWFEDSDTTAQSIAIIEHDCKCTVEWAKGIPGADQLIRESNGGMDYKYIIADLNVDYKERYLTKEENEHVERIYNEPGGKTRLAGLVWLLRIVREHPHLKRKIIVFSAYLDKIPKKEKYALGNDVVYIDKFSTQRLDTLIDKLNK